MKILLIVIDSRTNLCTIAGDVNKTPEGRAEMERRAVEESRRNPYHIYRLITAEPHPETLTTE